MYDARASVTGGKKKKKKTKQKKQWKKDCFGVEQEGDVIDAVDRFRDELDNGVETFLWGPESDDEDNNNEEEGRDSPGAGAATNGDSSGRYESYDESFSAQPKQRDRDRNRDRTS